jgi:hypothetical protein
MERNQLSRQSSRSSNAHLLSQHCAYSKLKAIPSSRRAQPRPPRDPRRKLVIYRQVTVDRLNIRAHIKQPSHTIHNRRQRLHRRKPYRRAQTLPPWLMPHLNNPDCTIHLNRSPVASVSHHLNACDRARL